MIWIAASSVLRPPDRLRCYQLFELQFAADGGFDAASGERGTPAFVGRIWSALGEHMQLTGVGHSPHWEGHEQDAPGTYVATYDLLDAGRISKKKVRYEQFFAKTLTGTTFCRPRRSSS